MSQSSSSVYRSFGAIVRSAIQNTNGLADLIDSEVSKRKAYTEHGRTLAQTSSSIALEFLDKLINILAQAEDKKDIWSLLKNLLDPRKNSGLYDFDLEPHLSSGELSAAGAQAIMKFIASDSPNLIKLVHDLAATIGIDEKIEAAEDIFQSKTASSYFFVPLSKGSKPGNYSNIFNKKRNLYNSHEVKKAAITELVFSGPTTRKRQSMQEDGSGLLQFMQSIKDLKIPLVLGDQFESKAEEPRTRLNTIAREEFGISDDTESAIKKLDSEYTRDILIPLCTGENKTLDDVRAIMQQNPNNLDPANPDQIKKGLIYSVLGLMPGSDEYYFVADLFKKDERETMLRPGETTFYNVPSIIIQKIQSMA